MNRRMYGLGSKRSVIREIFEFGKQRAAEVGAENVYDFSLGNPSVAPPQAVEDAIEDLLRGKDMTALHGYTSAPGDLATREAIAGHICKSFGVPADAGHIYMTCGAAASLTVTLNALTEPGDEFLLLAPYFPEYAVFVSAAGATPVVVPYDEATMLPDLAAFEKALSPRVKGVIVNSPNNPSGAVYPRELLEKMCAVLRAKEKEFGHPVVLIADEPYREIVYGGAEVPFLPCLYDNTVVCYSWSKSLSLPGERIGYIALSPRLHDAAGVYAAVCGAGRALGYVCAPSLFQKIVARCVDASPDIAAYESNRDLLYGALTDFGYTAVHPDGAFYLFVKALEEDANAFSDKAKELGLLIVPGDDFGAKGWVRISYCVSHDMIERSLPAFKKLKAMYDAE